jgi:hypothetical protein
MQKYITITSRDKLCLDCKLTVEYLVMDKPSWWRRWFLKEEPVARIKVETWYGGSTNDWHSGPPSFNKPPLYEELIFSSVWRHHVKEKNKLGIMGPYKTVIDLYKGVQDGFEIEEKNQGTRIKARVISFNDYKTSQDIDEN